MPQRSMAIVLLLAGVAPATAQTTLAWKFRAGDTFDVEQRILQTTSLETKNKPFKQKSEMSLQTRWQVKDVDKESAKVLVTVGALVSKTYAGDNKTGLASKEDELWRGAEFSLTVDAQGRLRELKGHEELLKSWPATVRNA